MLAEARPQAEAAGVAARAELVNDRPSTGLVGLADEVDAQMIVVGSYGEKPLKGALVGSTAHKLLHLSERPVLVVRAAVGASRRHHQGGAARGPAGARSARIRSPGRGRSRSTCARAA